MRGAIVSLLVVPLLIAPTSLSAQVQPPVEPGARVRVTSTEPVLNRVVGTCLELSDGHMQFEQQNGAVPWTIPFASMTELEVSRGQKSHRGRGAGIGFVVGAAVGAIAGSAMAARLDMATEQAALGGAGIFGLFGAGIGAIVSTSSKTDQWQEIPLDQLRVSLAPQRDGRLGIGLSLEF